MRSPSFSRGRLPPSLSSSTSSSSSSSSGRDGLRSIGGGRGPGLSSSSRRRGGRSEEVADIDGLDLDLDDDGSMRAYSPIGGDDADDGLARDAAADGGGIDRMREDFEYEMGGMTRTICCTAWHRYEILILVGVDCFTRWHSSLVSCLPLSPSTAT